METENKYANLKPIQENKYANLKPIQENKYANLKPIQEQSNDPRKHLSQSQIAEAESNKEGAKGLDVLHDKVTKYIPRGLMPTAFQMKPSSLVASIKGASHNFDEYASSINKGLDKVSKAILPKDSQTSFFSDNQKYWNDQRRMNEIETEDNKVAKIAGQLILDPVNLVGGGLVTKGSKVARIGKSMATGAGVGYAMSKAKNYGNDDLTAVQKNSEDAMSAGFVSVLNGIIAGVTKGRVTNAIKDVEFPPKVDKATGEARRATDEEKAQHVIDNAEELGFSPMEAQVLKEEVSKIVKPTQKPPTVLDSPMAQEAIDMARDRYASQTYNDRVGGGTGYWVDDNLVHHRAGAKGEKNYHQGFELSKADVAKIDKGKMTPEIEQKILADVNRLENDPHWNKEPDNDGAIEETIWLNEKDELLDPKTGQALFANAGQSLAAGFGAGTVNAGNEVYENGYNSDKVFEKFMQGMATGIIGVQGIRLLKKTNPKVFDKLKQYVVDNDIKPGTKLGVFAGDTPKHADDIVDDGKGFFDNNFDDVERLAKERADKGWEDISQDNGMIKNIKNTLKVGFTDTMSGKYHESRDITHANLEKANQQIGTFSKILNEFSDDTATKLQEYVSGGGSSDLPQSVKEVGDMYRQTVDSMGAELVERGVLDAQGYKEWVGVYSHRLYQPRVDKQGIKGAVQNFKQDKIGERGDSANFLPTDIKGMTGWLHKNGFIEDDGLVKFDDFADIKKHLEDTGKLGLLRDGNMKIIDKGEKITLHRDWTKTEREGMGEIVDARVNMPETLARLHRLKQHSEFLSRAETVEGVVAPKGLVSGMSTRDIAQLGYVKLDGVEYGALNRKWVRADVADDIGRTSRDVMQAHNDAFKSMNMLHGLWKKAKTVWNPTAHMNNFTGNLFVMHMAGIGSKNIPATINLGWTNIKALKRVEDLELGRLKKTLSRDEETELLQMRQSAKYAIEAKEIGIFGKSQLNDILSGMEEKVIKKGVLAKTDGVLSKLYQAEDNFNRLSFYVTLRNSGKDIKTAKQIVDYMLPDYTKPLPKGWRVLRDSSIAPFISWSYYTIPAIVKMLGTKRGAGKVAGVLGTLSVLEYYLSGREITPLDNLPFYNGKKPEDFKGRRFVIGKAGNEYNTIKMDRMIPYAELQDPINFAKSLFSGIVPNLAYTMNGRKMYDGRPITHKNKDAGDKTIDWIKHIAKQYTPIPVPVMNMVDLADSKLRSKKKRRKNNVIQPRDGVQELLKNVGINTMKYRIDKLKREQRGQ